MGTPARLLPSGKVVVGDEAWNVTDYGLPQQTEIELPVRNGGRTGAGS